MQTIADIGGKNLAHDAFMANEAGIPIKSQHLRHQLMLDDEAKKPVDDLFIDVTILPPTYLLMKMQV